MGTGPEYENLNHDVGPTLCRIHRARHTSIWILDPADRHPNPSPLRPGYWGITAHGTGTGTGRQYVLTGDKGKSPEQRTSLWNGETEIQTYQLDIAFAGGHNCNRWIIGSYCGLRFAF